MQQGHFLNHEQKIIKAKIMNDLLKVLDENLENNKSLFDDGSTLDMIGSILVMFNREVLITMIETYKLYQHKNSIMDDLFGMIKKQINEILKKYN